MTTKTANLATARAPTTSMLLRRVLEASRSLTARILVELRRSSLTSVDAGERQAAGLQRHPAQRRPPHRQLPRGDPQLGSRPGHVRQHLLYRRPARHYADRLAGADDAVQGSSGAAGTGTDRRRRADLPIADGRGHHALRREVRAGWGGPAPAHRVHA